MHRHSNAQRLLRLTRIGFFPLIRGRPQEQAASVKVKKMIRDGSPA